MSKKSNKKSPKKKLSKKPGAKKSKPKKVASAKKKAVKKPAKKVIKAKKKPAAPKKAKAKKAVAKTKTVKKPVKKAAPKKTAPKKALAKAAPPKTAPKKIEVKKPNSNHQDKTVLKVLKSDPKPAGNKAVAEPVAEATPEKPRVVHIVKQANKEAAATKKSAIIDIKTGPEPAGRFELEYVVHASAQILFEFITTPSGLSEWFCDDVNIRNGIYTFKWEDNEQNARVVKLVEEKLVRFQWMDKHDNSYFEFRLERDDLTNDISLIVVDFAETPEEKNSSTLLWNSQIDKLLHVLGAYF